MQYTLDSTDLEEVVKISTWKADYVGLQIKVVSGGPLTEFTIQQQITSEADPQTIASHISGGTNDFTERTIRIPEMYGPAVGPGSLGVGETCDLLINSSGEEILIIKAKASTAPTVIQVAYRTQ